MQTNEFLGKLCNATTIMNRRSYQFTLFGTPSPTQPWGYSLFGHHLSLNIAIRGKQMAATPMFLGAEPNVCLSSMFEMYMANTEQVIDSGLDQGVRILDAAGDLPLKIMQSLPRHLQQSARIFKNLHDENMPEDRWNPADQVVPTTPTVLTVLTDIKRHLAGAFQDNRVIPYEGIHASTMPFSLQDLLLETVTFYIAILPTGPYKARLAQIKQHWDETYFCWIGGFENTDAFYYRIQSPVVLIEFDHHSGVFLVNKDPAKFHVHTIVRTPNGGDYGGVLIDN